MQMDGEPWRQPIPAAADARVRRRPTGLQESPSAATGAAAGGAAPQASAATQQGQGQQQGEQQAATAGSVVTVRVSHAGQSHMLFNTEDPLGGRRVRTIAARGARESRPLTHRYSFLVPRGLSATPLDGGGVPPPEQT